MTTAGGLARQDVVTCRLSDRVGEVRPRVEASQYGFALVTSQRGTIYGRLRMSIMEGAGDEASAESVMEPGTSTVRPDLTAVEAHDRLAKQDLRTAVVSSPEGVLIGVVMREQLEEARQKAE